MSEIVKLSELKNGVSGIYKLNYPNGKIYIGLSADIRRRMYEHNNPNRLNNHPNMPCDLAIAKYGKFEEIEILEYVEPEFLEEREIYWIKFYNANNKEIGYNLTSGGQHLLGENSSQAVFSNEQVLDIRKRRWEGERKIDVYQDYKNFSFGTFEKIWLGKGYPQIGQEYIIPANSISRQVYSSVANSGERNNKAKLTEEDVRNIRKRFDMGEEIVKIAKDYPEVSKQTIRRVCKRETWKNID